MEEKMKNKFKTFSTIAKVIETIAIVAIILSIIFGILIGTSVLTQNEFLQNLVINITGEKTTNVNEILNKFLDDLLSNYTVESQPLALTILLSLIAYVSSIVILDSVRRLFKNISEDGRPFTEKNVKLVKILSIASWIVYIFKTDDIGTDLVLVLAITAMYYVFKYGCKLQTESDETL